MFSSNMDSLIALRESAEHLVSASFQEKGETEDGLVFDVGTRETGSPSYDSQRVGSLTPQSEKLVCV